MADALDPDGDTVVNPLMITRALKTVCRDTLFRVYKKLFYQKHPDGTTPSEALQGVKIAQYALQQNKDLKRTIQDNDENNFDISALCLLLKHVCGLTKSEGAWKDCSKLEGNIQVLKDLRNVDAHATAVTYRVQDPNLKWQQMVEALDNILLLTNFHDQREQVNSQLQDIKGMKIGAPLPKVRECLTRELEDMYTDGQKTRLQPFVWAGSNYSRHHHVDRTYVPTTLHCDGREIDGERLWKAAGDARVVVLEGETGTGKTSLLRHYAAAWAAHRAPFHHFDYLVLLDLTAVAANTFTLNDVLLEAFPDTFHEWGSTEIIRALASSAENVMFMIDAFDERLETFQEAIKKLQKTFSKALFVLATRPHCTLEVKSLCLGKCCVLTVRGFSQAQADQYVKKLFRIAKATEDPREFLAVISKYEELITVPQLLCWSSWFWLDGGADDSAAIKPTTRGEFFRHVTDFLIRKMCRIRGMRIVSGEIPKEGRDWLAAVSGLAFRQAKFHDSSYMSTSPEIMRLRRCAESLNLPPQEALSSLMQCDSSMRADGEHVVFQFIHRSHADYLVAYHLFQGCNSTLQLKRLLQEIQEDRMKSVLAFFVNLIYSNLKPQPEIFLNGLVKTVMPIFKEHVKFYNINYYLDLIEESRYNENFSKILAKNMPDPLNVVDFNHSPTSMKGKKVHSRLTGAKLQLLNKSDAAGVTEKFCTQLFLRPKELRRRPALLQLLEKVHPAKLWLRLCVGPSNEDENPVSGHKVIREDPMTALSLVTRAYARSSLQELWLSDCVCSTPIQSSGWPASLARLIIERCEFSCPCVLPSVGDKIVLRDCSKLKNVKFATGTRTLEFEEIKIGSLQLPDTVKSVTMTRCLLASSALLFSARLKNLKIVDSEIDNLDWPETLKELTLEVWSLPRTLPESLKKLNVRVPSGVMHFLYDSDGTLEMIEENLISCRSLTHLSLSGVAISPQRFLAFFLEFQDACPRCSLEVKNECELPRDADDDRDIIVATVETSPLPSVTVWFGREKFSNSLTLEVLSEVQIA